MHSKPRVLHVFRSPLGGLFRHVVDVVEESRKRGIHCGVILNSDESPEHIQYSRLVGSANLGVEPMPIYRSPCLRDVLNIIRIARIAKRLRIDIIHGHGAKGGVYARGVSLVLGAKMRSIYTPHGGSLHYVGNGISHRLFRTIERRLLDFTSGLVLESKFASLEFSRLFGRPRCDVCIIPNGLRLSESTKIEPDLNASDFVFLGELRKLKGIDTLLDALIILGEEGEKVSIKIFGDGPDKQYFMNRVRDEAIDGVNFMGASVGCTPAFRSGKCLVFPSYAESMPYVVLEAVAAQVPLIATDVGGVREIVGQNFPLLHPGNAMELAKCMREALNGNVSQFGLAKDDLRSFLNRFSVDAMVSDLLSFYERVSFIR